MQPMTLPRLQRHLTANARKRGFTLIELIIVIAIILILLAIIAVAMVYILAESDEETTENYLSIIGGGVEGIETDKQIIQLVQPKRSGFLRENLNPAFKNAIGFEKGNWAQLGHEQRSMLLYFLIAPRKSEWERCVTPACASSVEFKPRVPEDQGGGMRSALDEGFGILIDRWDGPISFKFLTGSTGASRSTPEWVLISAGPDGDYDTKEDNIYYSRDQKKGYKE